MKSCKRFFGLALVFVLCSSVWADVPQLINFQGVLKDGSGNPVANASYSVTFTIYDAPAGGTNLWTETQSVTTAGGLFAVLLGSTNPVPDSIFKGSNRWLGIAVSPDGEMPARQQLVSVGYSYRVNSVDGATGGTIFGNTGIQSDLSVSGKATIGPGQTNTGTNAFVAGGSNTVSGEGSTVGGGEGNIASTFVATVGGGFINTASGEAATVGGGYSNTASGDRATVGGGYSNTANGDYATVGGGAFNTASGDYATVPGGLFNTAAGSWSSFAAGYRAKADHAGTFVWGDNTEADFASTADNQFLIRADKVGIGTNAPAQKLDVAGTAQMTGFKLPTGASNGFVLTSDATGLGTWQAGGGGGGGGWTDDGTAVRLTTITDNVGIGTTSPANKLDVEGGAVIGATYSGTNTAPANGLLVEGVVGIGTSSTTGGLLVVAGEIRATGPTHGYATVDRATGTNAMIMYLDGGYLKFDDYGMTTPRMVIQRTSGNVGIGTATVGASNLLELSSTTKGLVLPRMTKAQRNAIASPAAGMMVYQTDNTPGLRVYNGTNWMRFTETVD